MSSFTLLHILGVAFGLGIATGMDLLLVKHILTKKILRETQYLFITQLSKIVTWGLILLWFSGMGFLWKYQQVSPEKLLNPKIWSKLMIVTILTINGIFIHHFLLPKLKACIDKRVNEVCSYNEMALIFSSGAISMVSWYVPFIYGTVPKLNFAFSFSVFTAAYLVIIAAAILCSLAVLGFVYNKHVSTVNSARPELLEANAFDSQYSKEITTMIKNG